jgi:hypothetical protein
MKTAENLESGDSDAALDSLVFKARQSKAASRYDHPGLAAALQICFSAAC